MLGADQVLALAEKVARGCPADGVEVACQMGLSALTRFANGQIHQNVAAETAEVRVRALVGRRVGVAVTSSLDDDALLRAANGAASAARLTPERPGFARLPAPAPLPRVEGYAPATATCGPEERAALVAVICQRAQSRGLLAAGACATQTVERCVWNTRGVAAYAQTTSADLHAVVMAPDGEASGYAARAARDVAALDPAALAEEAVERAVQARDPVELPEGTYEVVLEPYAVADVVEMLAYLGFGARTYQDGTSFLCGRLGQKLVSERVSLWDDALDGRGLPFPFDAEGVPKQPVTLIERGVARDLVHDSETAARAGRTSTGHALPPPNPLGPLPVSLFLGGGDAPGVSHLVANVEHGVLVTRFWYTRPVHPLPVLVTGMTRDGTFRIREGRVVGPVRNTRYTQSYLEALSDVRGLTQRGVLLHGDMFGAYHVPALHLGRWRFHRTAA